MTRLRGLALLAFFLCSSLAAQAKIPETPQATPCSDSIGGVEVIITHDRFNSVLAFPLDDGNTRIEASIDGGGLSGNIVLKNKTSRSAIHGWEAFHYLVERFDGRFSYLSEVLDYRKSEQLQLFNRLTSSPQNLSPQEAALQTFTGKMAQRHGYTTIEFDPSQTIGSPGHYQRLRLRYIKPNADPTPDGWLVKASEKMYSAVNADHFSSVMGALVPPNQTLEIAIDGDSPDTPAILRGILQYFEGRFSRIRMSIRAKKTPKLHQTLAKLRTFEPRIFAAKFFENPVGTPFFALGYTSIRRRFDDRSQTIALEIHSGPSRNYWLQYKASAP